MEPATNGIMFVLTIAGIVVSVGIITQQAEWCSLAACICGMALALVEAICWAIRTK